MLEDYCGVWIRIQQRMAWPGTVEWGGNQRNAAECPGLHYKDSQQGAFDLENILPEYSAWNKPWSHEITTNLSFVQAMMHLRLNLMPILLAGTVCSSQEIENAYNTAGLSVQLLLKQAESHGCSLKLNISQLENETLLAKLGRVPFVMSKGLLPLGKSAEASRPIPLTSSKQLPALLTRRSSTDLDEISSNSQAEEINLLKVCGST